APGDAEAAREAPEVAAVAIGHPEGDHELVGAPQVSRQEGEGLEEALDILAVVLAPDGKDERVLELHHAPAGLGRSLRSGGRGPERGRDAGADGGHPGWIEAEPGDRLFPAC